MAARKPKTNNTSVKRSTDDKVQQGPKTCFVIMPFKTEQSLQKVYDRAIKPAVKGAGLRCVRGDEIPEAGLVIEHIVKATHDADVIIADLTGNNPNVLYELGLAHSFAKPVIMLSQNVGDAPFDLKNYRIIPYNTTEFDSAEELRENIVKALKSVVAGTQLRSNPVHLFLPEIGTSREREEARQRTSELLEKNSRLQAENAGLRELRNLAQSIIDNLGATLNLGEIQQKIDEQSEDESVDVPLGSGMTGRKLVFKKVPKSKRIKVNLPPKGRE